MEKEISNQIIQEVLLAAASSVCCTVCGVEEMVMPMDDQPLDETFLANYVCSECEDLSPANGSAQI